MDPLDKQTHGRQHVIEPLVGASHNKSSNHRLHGSTSTGQLNKKWRMNPYRHETPESIATEFGTVDYKPTS